MIRNKVAPPHPFNPIVLLQLSIAECECNDMKILMIAQPYYTVITDTTCREECAQTGPSTQTTYTHPHTESCL